jgi:flagellar motor component MotA
LLVAWRLAWVAAALLALGAAGSFFAVKTGDSAQESLGKLPPAVETLADAHEKWAERTEIVGAVAAALAVVAAVLGTVPAWSRR